MYIQLTILSLNQLAFKKYSKYKSQHCLSSFFMRRLMLQIGGELCFQKGFKDFFVYAHTLKEFFGCPLLGEIEDLCHKVYHYHLRLKRCCLKLFSDLQIFCIHFLPLQSVLLINTSGFFLKRTDHIALLFKSMHGSPLPGQQCLMFLEHSRSHPSAADLNFTSHNFSSLTP